MAMMERKQFQKFLEFAITLGFPLRFIPIMDPQYRFGNVSINAI